MRLLTSLLAISLLVSGCGNDDMVGPPPEDGVFMQPSQSVYEPGDEIRITLINRTNRTVVYVICGFFGIQRYVDDRWVYLDGLCPSLPERFEVAPYETSTLSAEYFGGALAGKYRATTQVCYEGTNDCETVHSEPYKLAE